MMVFRQKKWIMKKHKVMIYLPERFLSPLNRPWTLSKLAYKVSFLNNVTVDFLTNFTRRLIVMMVSLFLGVFLTYNSVFADFC